MGSKGTTTKTYAGDPNARAAGYEALGMARNAAKTPYENAVVGWNPAQQEGLEGIRGAQGMAQPYFDEAAGYARDSGSPLTKEDIDRFYNPYADSVLANLKEVYGQQNRNVTGQLTQGAGGVGASRIAVGQSELARQQGLSTGQTMASLYDRAVAAAQADKGRAGQAAFTMGNLGAGSQSAQIQGAGALLGAGTQQQQNDQRALTARLAFPYQQGQYLAGVSGSLSGLSGTEQTTAPPPNPFSQLLGLGVAGAGVYGIGADQGWWGAGSGGGTGDGGGSGGYYNPIPAGYTGYGYADGGSIGDTGIPSVSLAPIQRHKFAEDKSGGSGGGIGDVVGSVAKILPFILARGGRVDSGRTSHVDHLSRMAMHLLSDGGAVGPEKMFQRYARGGEAEMPFDTRFVSALETLDQGQMAPEMGANYPIEGGNQSTDIAPNYEPPISDMRSYLTERGAFPADARQGAMVAAREATPGINPMMAAGVPMPMDRPGDIPETPMAPAIVASGADATVPGMTGPIPPPMTPPPTPTVPYAGGDTVPYGPDRQMDAGEKFTRSPWMGLIQAGLATAAGTSPYAGVNIGKGGMEGIKALQEQRKEGREEEGINQRARKLAQEAREHLDKYGKIPLVDQENQKIARERLVQENFKPTGAFDADGNPVLFNSKTGQSQSTGKPANIPAADTVSDAPINPKLDTVLDLSPSVASSFGIKRPATMTTGERQIAKRAADKIEQEAVKNAETAAQSKYRFLELKNDLAQLPEDGWLSPGSYAGRRMEVAKQVNSISQFMGGKPWFDPKQIGALEEAEKVNTIGGFLQSRLTGGGQHNAAVIIQASMRAFPGAENTKLGADMIINGALQAIRREEERHEFLVRNKQKFGGDLSAASLAFNKLNPIEKYVNRAKLESIPPEHLEVIQRNLNNPSAVNSFEKKYGKGILDLLRPPNG